MAAYRRVYDSRHLQADCQEPGSALEPYARQSSMGYVYLFTCLSGARCILLIFRSICRVTSPLLWPPSVHGGAYHFAADAMMLTGHSSVNNVMMICMIPADDMEICFTILPLYNVFMITMI